MADALMKYETIDASQIDSIMAGQLPSAPEGWTEKHTAAEPVKPAAEQAGDVKPDLRKEDKPSEDSKPSEGNNENEDKDQGNLH